MRPAHYRLLVDRLTHQRDVVATWQLQEDGLSQATVRWLLRDWRAMHRGVYTAGHAPPTDWQRCYAATITESGTLLARWSAAAHFGVRSLPEREPMHVVRHGASGRRHYERATPAQRRRPGEPASSATGERDAATIGPGRTGDNAKRTAGGHASAPNQHAGQRLDALMVRYSTTLAADMTEHEGIQTTTAARMLLDLFVDCGATASDRLFRDALRLKLVDRQDLRDLARAHAGERGVGRIRELLSRYEQIPIERTRSDPEIEALVVLRDAGERIPEVNVQVAGFEGDLVDHERKVILELDGPQYHQFPERDRERDEAWTNAGYTVQRRATDDAYRAPDSIIRGAHGAD